MENRPEQSSGTGMSPAVRKTTRTSESHSAKRAKAQKDTPVKLEKSDTSSIAPLHDLCMRNLRVRRYQAATINTVDSLLWTILAFRPQACKDSLGALNLSLRNLADRIEGLVDKQETHITWMKFHLNSLLSSALKSTVADYSSPAYTEDEEGFRTGLTIPAPSEDLVKLKPFTGFLSKMMFFALKRNDVDFIYSLAQSKRAWLPPTDYAHGASIDKYAKILGTPRAAIGPRAAAVITAVTLEVFENLKQPTKFLPSGRAAHEQPIKSGGNWMDVPPFEPFSQGPRPHPRHRGELVEDVHAFNDWRQLTWAQLLQEARNLPTRQPGALGRDSDTTCVNDASAQQLDEPGAKIRTISKGVAVAYLAIQPAQGQMTNAWKQHPTNTWTESPFDKVERIYREMVPFRERYAEHEDFAWNSGDYSAATDKLKSESTRIMLNALRQRQEAIGFDGVPVSALDVLEATFADGGKIHCPAVKDGPDGPQKAFTFTQRNGQLMGHPCSFPLLCTVNLSVHRLMLDLWWESDYSLHCREDEAFKDALATNVIINGDDILFFGPASLFLFFREASAGVGLEVSVGKNYLSRTCAMINSQLFQESGGEMKRRGYLNMKLMLGSTTDEGKPTSTPDQLGRDLGEMMAAAPWTSRALPLAFRRFPSARLQNGFQPNWFMPVHLGGYGVPVRFASDTMSVTREQRLIASQFILNPKMMLFQLKGTAEKFGLMKARKTKVITSASFADHKDSYDFLVAEHERSHPRPLRIAREGFTAEAWRDYLVDLHQANGTADHLPPFGEQASEATEDFWPAVAIGIDSQAAHQATAELNVESRDAKYAHGEWLLNRGIYPTRIAHFERRFRNDNLVEHVADSVELRQMGMDRAANYLKSVQAATTANAVRKAAGEAEVMGTLAKDPVFLLTSRKLMRKYGRIKPVKPATDQELLAWWDPVVASTAPRRIPPVNVLVDPTVKRTPIARTAVLSINDESTPSA